MTILGRAHVAVKPRFCAISSRQMLHTRRCPTSREAEWCTHRTRCTVARCRSRFFGLNNVTPRVLDGENMRVDRYNAADASSSTGVFQLHALRCALRRGDGLPSQRYVRAFPNSAWSWSNAGEQSHSYNAVSLRICICNCATAPCFLSKWLLRTQQPNARSGSCGARVHAYRERDI